MPKLSNATTPANDPLCMIHQPHPIPALPANPARWNSPGERKIVEVFPSIFLADKKGANYFHNHAPQFCHILVRSDGNLAPGHDPNTSAKLYMDNQAKDMPLDPIPLEVKHDFFRTRAKLVNHATGQIHVANPGLRETLQACQRGTLSQIFREDEN
jgi:hypothetical protein